MSRSLRAVTSGAIALMCLVLMAAPVSANDVLPRLFSNMPVNANQLSLSYIYSTGNVAVDPNLALDVEADLHTYSLSYTRSFAAFGQSAWFTAILPYADLSLTGILQGERVTAGDDRMPDPRLRLALNLSGAPALGVAEFAGYRQKTIVGFNIEVTPPLGHYDNTRRVNFGSNRWTFAPELGFSRRLGRFALEGALSAIFFTDNDDYLGVSTLSQKPIGVARANLIRYLSRPGTWVGVSGMYLSGGESSIDGVTGSDLQTNSRLGAALSVPFARRHNLLFKFSTGVTTRIGADFDNYQVVYSVLF